MKKLPTKQLNKWIKFSQAGVQMAATIAICALAGNWLDGKFPELYPLFTVVLSLFGVFAAMYTIIRQAMNMSDKP
ncbi:AtpZ/AtpI family protein [Capnocytophaga sp.]|uniref:AtpZ/AtpI family protein n=1 Tax=Capnocytophaga sp. TaxID=44737 RepID=UPI0026DB7E51|nr:AtpZ/AtpI family protein [Capnocytophaga sp.]MDO5104282.1 AtpZ/AtpI family protein [Capnocytophaga sp.]